MAPFCLLSALLMVVTMSDICHASYDVHDDYITSAPVVYERRRGEENYNNWLTKLLRKTSDMDLSPRKPTCSNGMEYTEESRLAIRTCHRTIPALISRVYFSACQCPVITPLWDSSTSRCIRKEECECEGGQVKTGNANLCDRITCSNGKIWKPQLPAFMCRMVLSQCHCPTDRPVWHKQHNKCITVDECLPETEPECEGSQVMKTCRDYCGNKPCASDVYGTAEYNDCLREMQYVKYACTPGCGCHDDMVWSHHRCVNPVECPVIEPVCEGGMVQTSCVDPCQPHTCDNQTYIMCRNMLGSIQKPCHPGCQCPKEAPILHHGRCIEYAECPVTSCSAGMIHTYCKNRCGPITCDDTQYERCMMLPSDYMCEPGCECPPDRPIFHNGRCTTRSYCPSSGPTLGCEWKQCGDYCYFEMTCQTVVNGGPIPDCAAPPPDGIPCHERCQCPPERPIHHNGACVEPKDCYVKHDCPGEQHFELCGPTCHPDFTCDWVAEGRPFPICEMPPPGYGCQPTCQCPTDRPIFHEGYCINEALCPTPTCRGGRDLVPCKSICGDKPCTTDPHQIAVYEDCIASLPYIDYMCQPGCMCPHNKPVWDDDRGCVMESECPHVLPPLCPGDMVYTDCADMCGPIQCDNSSYVRCLDQMSMLGDTGHATCQAGCRCPRDRPVYHNDQCIPHTQCPSSSSMSCEWSSCGDYCYWEVSCNDVIMGTATRACQAPPAGSYPCTEKCQCPPEKPIHHDGRCVTRDECFVKRDCPGEQEFQICGTSCLPDQTCEWVSMGMPMPMCSPLHPNHGCSPRCACPHDRPVYHQGRCITASMCPNTQQCTGGMEWRDCIDVCAANRTCDGTAYEKCLVWSQTVFLTCTPGCQCPADRPVYHNGQCYHQDECLHGGCEHMVCGDSCYWEQTCHTIMNRVSRPDCSATTGCRPTCQCPSETPIHHNGQCVHPKECFNTTNICPGDMEFRVCGDMCYFPMSCGGGPMPVCAAFPQGHGCVSTCQCPEDRPIYHQNRCVKKEECPVCEGGKMWMECGSACPTTCATVRNANVIGACLAVCVPECQCPYDQAWDDRVNHCVPQHQCYSDSNSSMCTGGQVYVPCATQCGNQSCQTWNPEERCHFFDCFPQCECPPERPVFENGQCVSYSTCPQCYEGGKIWMECGSGCAPTCQELQTGAGMGPCTTGCVAQCQCPDYQPVWHETLLQCVTLETCLSGDTNNNCAGGQVWNSCGSACSNPDCATYMTAASCTMQCVPRCECPSHKRVWKNGQCVAESECATTPSCPVNQEWDQCGDVCPRTCDNYQEDMDCIEICRMEGACKCADGLVRVSNGSECVPVDDCPAPITCPSGMVFSSCVRFCQFQICDMQMPPCGMDEPCLEGCVCPPSAPFLDMPLDLCVPECLTNVNVPSCPANMVWSECPSPCGDPTCESLMVIISEPVCQPDPNKCVPRCACPVDFPILMNDECYPVTVCT